MQLKEMHKFIIDLVLILQTKVSGEEKMKTLPKENKEYTKGQLYEAQYILEVVEKIIYENKTYTF
jgi:hypothetical protein